MGNCVRRGKDYRRLWNGANFAANGWRSNLIIWLWWIMSKRGPAAPKKLLTGLIGAPIAHSASPAMHERAADALGVRCHYHLIEVAGAGRDQFRALVDGVRNLGFAGVNITFPYKEAVIELVDELSPGAAAIG